MGTTTDQKDPRLGHGADNEPRAQNAAYLVLSEEERAKGFVRPVRSSYEHVGIVGPTHPTRNLTPEELERFGGNEYVTYEEFPSEMAPRAGRFWTQQQLDSVGKGCGTRTSMAIDIAETYARKPEFYGSTYCVRCRMHLPVGADGEFVWTGTNIRVGT